MSRERDIDDIKVYDERLLNLRVQVVDMPDSIHGACSLRPDGSFLIFINNRDSNQKQKKAFLHEMLHIWRRDHEKQGISANEIEYQCHNDIDLDEILSDFG